MKQESGSDKARQNKYRYAASTRPKRRSASNWKGYATMRHLGACRQPENAERQTALRCCANMPARKVPRSIHENARDVARDIPSSPSK